MIFIMKFLRKLLSFRYLVILLTFFYAVIYFLKAKAYLDPDFGWGIRVGEYILKSRIPQNDPFSYTMPSYPFIDFSWLTHVIMFRLYSEIGYIGLAIFFTTIAVSALLVIIWKSDWKLIFLQILFGASILFFYFGVRSQVVSWFFFAILSQLILDDTVWRRFRYIVPLLFLLWANLHGGFVAGLGILLITIITKYLANFSSKTWKKALPDIFVVVLSACFTLINPHGISLWRELIGSMTNVSIRFNISEWQPLSYRSSLLIFIFISFSLAFLYQFRNKYSRHVFLVYIILLIAGFSSTRNVPLFVIYTLIAIKIGFQYFLREVGNNKLNLFRFRIIYVFFFLFVLILAIEQVKNNYLAAVASGEQAYPQQAINYLIKHPSKGQIFSSYGWGGYLIWRLPQKKVFIDGRMPTWRQKAIPNESRSAYEDYNSVFVMKTSMSRIFKKYNIDTVLLPKQWFTRNEDVKTQQTILKFVNELKKNNYMQVLQDEIAYIFKKTPSTTEDNWEEE